MTLKMTRSDCNHGLDRLFFHVDTSRFSADRPEADEEASTGAEVLPPHTEPVRHRNVLSRNLVSSAFFVFDRIPSLPTRKLS